MDKPRETKDKKVLLEVYIREDIRRRLSDYCVYTNAEPSTVVENALVEYFHEGDVSH